MENSSYTCCDTRLLEKLDYDKKKKKRLTKFEYEMNSFAYMYQLCFVLNFWGVHVYLNEMGVFSCRCFWNTMTVVLFFTTCWNFHWRSLMRVHTEIIAKSDIFRDLGWEAKFVKQLLVYSKVSRSKTWPRFSYLVINSDYWLFLVPLRWNILCTPKLK
jgi:hypothetical protein